MTNTAKLKGAITAAGFTQDDVAKRLNISATAFNNKVTGKSEFKASEIIALKRLLNLTWDEVEEIFFAEKVD